MLAPQADPRPEVQELLDSIQHRGQEISRLAAHLAELEEDGIYGYYRHSVKVYQLQHAVRACRNLLRSLAPHDAYLNPWFVAICRGACGHRSRWATNPREWQSEARPILEGFWHCAYFVRMLSRLCGESEDSLGRLASGQAAVLELYGLR